MSAPGGSGPSRPSKKLVGQDPAFRVKTPGAHPSDVPPSQTSPSEVSPPSSGGPSSPAADTPGSTRPTRPGKAAGGGAGRGRSQAGRKTSRAPRRSESSGQGGTRGAPGPRGLDADAKVDRTTATGSGAVAAEGTVSSTAETPPARRAARESTDHGSVRFRASPPLMVVDSTVHPVSAVTGGGQAGPGATEFNEVRPSSVPDAVMSGAAEPQPSPGEPEPPRDGKVPGPEGVEPLPGTTRAESDESSQAAERKDQRPAPEIDPVGSKNGESIDLVAARAMPPPSGALVGADGLPPPAGHTPNGRSPASGLSAATVMYSAAARFSSAAAAIGRSAAPEADRSATAAVNTAAYEAITTAVTATAEGLSSARSFTSSGGQAVATGLQSSPTGGWSVPRMRLRRPKKPAAAVATLAVGQSIATAMTSSPTGGWRIPQMRLRRRPRVSAATENTGASTAAPAPPANLAGLRSKPIPLRKRVFASSSIVRRTSATVPTALETKTATDKAMEEALAIANEAFVVSASGAAVATGVANAATTEAEPTSAETTDGDSGGAVADEGGHGGDGSASSTQSPPNRSSTVAIDEAPSSAEDGEASDATTVAEGGAESANGAADATIVDEAITPDEPSDDATGDARAADDWATTGNATNAGGATTPAEEAPATDERVIAGDATVATDATTIEGEVDATQSIATDQGNTMHGWFSPADIVTADGSTATAEEASDESVGAGDGASAVDGLRIADTVASAGLVVAGEAVTTDQPSSAADVIAEDDSTAGAPDAAAAGLVPAGEAAILDEWSGMGDVVTADGSTATAQETSDESVGTGDGASAVDEMTGDGLGAADLVIASEAATMEQPSSAADVIAEDESATIAHDAAPTADQPSGTGELATLDGVPTTAGEDVALDRAVTSDEPETPDQAGITNAATTVDDTTTIIPAVPDDIPVVPPLGRLRVADQSAPREGGTQSAGSGTGPSTLDASATSAAETVKPKPAAVPGTLPAPTPAPATPVRRRPRRARLKVTRTDPWSVTKIAFMLSLAAGIMTVVAVAFLWMALDAAGVFSKVGETVNSVTSGGADKGFDLEGYLTLSRVLGITGIIAAVEVVVMTALATLLAFMYNVSSGMVGGVEVTLAEDD